MKTKFISKNSNELIVFIMGWGADDNQYKGMTSKRDLLLCWNYGDLNFDFDFSKYKSIYLITHSAGVFAAGLIKDKLPKFTYKLAINGNPKMFDDYFGINKDFIKIVYNLTPDNCTEFKRKYIVFDDNELKEFDKNMSLRTFEDCFYELDKLQEYYSKPYTPMEYDFALISDCDKVYSPIRQMEYFKGKYKILKNKAHNIFSGFKTFDEVLEVK